MNFYPFHLGDYAAHTRHLSLMEDLAYRRMLDLYYTSEAPLPADPAKVARLIGMRDYMQEVTDVLSEFFVKSDAGYKSARCEREIEAYKAKAERAKSANKARWNAKHDGEGSKPDLKPDAKSDVKSDADQVPTNNQKPLPEEEPPKPPVGGLTVVAKPESKPKTRGVALKTFLADCKANDIRPIRDYEPLWTYTRTAKLPDDFVALAWVEFCRRFGAGGVKEANVQKDWRKTFRNYVENNYLKLWAVNADGEYYLTTQGKQAQTVAEAA
jgi:uncharacterized protein YdaU (DUF1376 family)